MSKPQVYYADNTKSKPKYRGVSHQYGFFIAIILSMYLLYMTPTEKFWPIAIYCFGLCGMLGISSSYHRLKWTVKSETWIRRLDYVMISVMIAGCFTPYCALVFDSWYSTFVLWTLWLGVAFCVILNLIWVNSPKVFRTSVYMLLGWVGMPLMPELIETCGWTCTILNLIGGFFHTVGGITYARQSPNPYPDIFGYHEIFHACVIIASFLHYYTVLVYTI
jgi:hemolysin III